MDLQSFVVANASYLTIGDMMEELGAEYTYSDIYAMHGRLKIVPLTERKKNENYIKMVWHKMTMIEISKKLEISEKLVKKICTELNLESSKKIVKTKKTICQILSGYKFQLDELDFLRDTKTRHEECN